MHEQTVHTFDYLLYSGYPVYRPRMSKSDVLTRYTL